MNLKAVLAQERDAGLCFVPEELALVVLLRGFFCLEPTLELCEGSAGDAQELLVVLYLVRLTALNQIAEGNVPSNRTRIGTEILRLGEVREERDGVSDVPGLDARVGAYDGVARCEEEVDSLAVRLDENVGVREGLTGEAKTVVLGACDGGRHVVCFWNFALASCFYRDLVREFAHVRVPATRKRFASQLGGKIRPFDSTKSVKAARISLSEKIVITCGMYWYLQYISFGVGSWTT